MSIDPNMKIVCPHCGQPSDNIKRLNILLMIFLFIGARWEKQQVTACGNCMRSRILSNAIINILSANVLWPFFILPYSIYNVIQSYQPGHSESVLSEIRYRTRPATSTEFDEIFKDMFKQKKTTPGEKPPSP